MDIEMRQVTECIQKGVLHVRCCIHDCPSEPFSYQLIAQHASSTAFNALQDRIQAVHDEQREIRFEDEMQLREAALLQKSAREIELLQVRKHIENEIMVLRCPKCRLVFMEFNGCAALTCEAEDARGTKRGGCGCHFCAFCFQDCGGDAHQHVAHCRLNASKDVYPPQGAWERAMKERRRISLHQYWAGLNPELKTAASADGGVRQAFKGRGIEHELQQPGGFHWDLEVAQIAGMGFGDLDAVRGALQRVDGDVQGALNLLGIE